MSTFLLLERHHVDIDMSHIGKSLSLDDTLSNRRINEDPRLYVLTKILEKCFEAKCFTCFFDRGV